MPLIPTSVFSPKPSFGGGSDRQRGPKESSRGPKRSPLSFRRSPRQNKELTDVGRRHAEKKERTRLKMKGKLGKLSQEYESGRLGMPENIKKKGYQLGLKPVADATPQQAEAQEQAIEGLSKKQQKLFRKKGLVAGMYSLTEDQRKQFQESGLERSLKGQAEEKAAGFFSSPENQGISYSDIPKSLKRDLLLGNMFVDDFLPDDIQTQLNKDIKKMHDLQEAHGEGVTTDAQRQEVLRNAQDIQDRYGIRPEDYQEYLKTGGQDNGLLAGVLAPLFRQMTPEARKACGVDDVDSFCQRNVARPVSQTNRGGTVTNSYRPSRGGSGGGSGGGGGGSGGGGSFSTPSSSTPVGPIQSLEDFPELVGSLNIDNRDWNEAQVNEIRRNGGIRINMDCNQADSRKVIPPLIVIPDDATPQMRAAAQAYVDAMAKIHNEKFGRNFTGRVLSRGQNGRGRVNTIHTEGWSIEDTQMVGYLMSPEGISEYQDILENTLGKIPGAVFGLPHGGVSGKDKGAKYNGQNEVSVARAHLEGFAKNQKEGGTTEKEEEAIV